MTCPTTAKGLLRTMGRNSTFNILMYSHDTYGLGHIRRSMAIAAHLRGAGINTLILTGSPIAGRFTFPDQIDFVRIPGMIKKTNEEYLPLSIKIRPTQALDIRKNIITATAKTFRPHLFLVDKEPLGLRKEVLPTLQWLRRCMPETRTVLGLRDILDDAETIRHDWTQKGVYKALDELYSEIWIYGVQSFYDPVTEYAIPETVSPKIRFTGYIPREIPDPAIARKIRREMGAKNGEPLVVVTTGGGGDGYAVMDGFLSMLESETLPIFKSVLVTGPFMPQTERKNVFERASRLGVRAFQFYRRMEKLLAAADLVVSMGGYNTICEILSQGTLSLVIPRETPRQEQLIRARVLKRQHLVDYLPWQELTPRALRDKVAFLLTKPEPFREAIGKFRMTAYDVMRQRLCAFRGKAT